MTLAEMSRAEKVYRRLVGMSSFQMTGSFIISFNKNVFVAHPVLIVHKSFKGHDDDPRGNEQQCSAQYSEELFLKPLTIDWGPFFFFFFISNQSSQIYISPEKLEQTFTFQYS